MAAKVLGILFVFSLVLEVISVRCNYNTSKYFNVTTAAFSAQLTFMDFCILFVWLLLEQTHNYEVWNFNSDNFIYNWYKIDICFEVLLSFTVVTSTVYNTLPAMWKS